MDRSNHEHLGLRYLRVASSLREMIASGEYKPGERLPRQHDLAREHGVAFTTLNKALDVLEAEGYIVRKPGLGTYASLPEDRKPAAPVVDNSLSSTRAITRALEQSGWRGVVVTTCEAAVEKFENQEFRLVIMDLSMAVTNGCDTFRRIRQLDPEVPVVILTADQELTLMSMALQVGTFAVMRKPVTANGISRLVGGIANRSQLSKST